MKKSLTLILVGILLGSTVTFATSKFFSDVPDDAWYSDAVTSLSEKGIINGYPDGTYGPNNDINRAELAVMLDRLIEYIENEKISQDEDFTPVFSSSAPPTIIYKTKEDYYNYVPITLSDDKSTITSYPAITDIYYNDKLAYPTNLAQGYLLDNRGLGSDSAFLEITYEEYANFTETPYANELIEKILDDNPFTEIYDCGSRYVFEENEVAELNGIINSGQLTKCNSLN